MNIYVSGSLAYDRIMDFPGKFSDHILPNKIHILNVCFAINELRENFGGTAGNIAYTLSLFGEKPFIVAAAGRDFDSYRSWLEQNNLPPDHISIIEAELTAGAYITTDQSDNQITAFNPGAMKHRSAFDFTLSDPGKTMAVVAPGNLDDMYRFAGDCRKSGTSYIFDPGQSLPAWDSAKLSESIDGSEIFISNDYELELTSQKTGWKTDELIKHTGLLITTLGEHGSVLQFLDEDRVKTIEIPAVKPSEVLDPTGAGDAYRGGLVKGLLLRRKDIVHAARMGSVSAAYAVETYGTQNFNFTHDEFNRRFLESFGENAYEHEHS